MWFDYIKQFIYFQKLLFTLFCNSVYKYFYNDYSSSLMNTLYNDIMLNGGVVIKLTQWIITRYTILYRDKEKPEWLIQFSNIYENCDKHPIEYTEQLFIELFGKNTDDYFESFIKDPVASGSVGQVYKAVLKNKTVVAIKVMHPNMDVKAKIPIYFLKLYNFILKKCKFMYKYALPFDLDSFFDDILKQIDFSYEFDNLIKFNKYYKDNPLVIFPKPYFRSKKLMITSFEEGTFFENIDITEYKKYKIVQLLTLFVRDTSIIHNLMHGDLHQGNWKVRLVNKEYALVIYDVGVCFELDRDNIQNFWFYWETADKVNLAKLFTRCIHYYPNTLTLQNIETGIFNNLTDIAIKPMNASHTIGETLKYMNSNDIIMDSYWLNLCITVSLVEDFFKKYGIVEDANNVNSENTIQDVFKVFYLNYITYCKTYNVFPELKTHMEKCLHDANIKFDDLFSNVEHRLNHKNNNSKFPNIVMDNTNNSDKIELSI